MSTLLHVREVRKRFRGQRSSALKGVDFEIHDGELLTLVGASGSGKSTLLRIIAGLESPDEGEVLLDDQLMTKGRSIVVPPERRQIGLVFQNHALFPHLTIRDNVGFGLEKAIRGERVESMLDLVGLAEMAERYPHELSGGERQRIALVRALAREPRLVLLDEPFSNLDQSLRIELRDETCRLLRERHATTILVTHDTEDALAVSDRIAVLRGGEIQQIGTPTEIYCKPVNRNVASSFGPCNFLQRSLLNKEAAPAGKAGIQPENEADDEIWIRPEGLALSEHDDGGSLAAGVVSQSIFYGGTRIVTLECTSPTGVPFSLAVRLYGQSDPDPGEQFHVKLKD